MLRCGVPLGVLVALSVPACVPDKLVLDPDTESQGESSNGSGGSAANGTPATGIGGAATSTDDNSTGSGGSAGAGTGTGGSVGTGCGDGSRTASEACDDGNSANGDGCDDGCEVEDGFECEGSPSVCRSIDCGDGRVAGMESCDDGNTVPFDGCSADCQLEPDCSEGACVSPCGDGIVHEEECDDGNLLDGDGCSSSCAVESGFTCDVPNCQAIGDKCVRRLSAIVRDFNPAGASNGHPDFEPTTGSQDVIPGLVESELDLERKPVFSGASGGNIESTDSFAEWYRDAPGVNATTVGEIVLWDNGSGAFVNRWGVGGEPWLAYQDPVYCGVAGAACSDPDGLLGCTVDESTQKCLDPCDIWADEDSACVVTTIPVDGTPLFFPIDTSPTVLDGERYRAQVPPIYREGDSAGAWTYELPTPRETEAPLHNFHFTTEIRFWFRYDPEFRVTLNFLGDDDVWVFLNGKLALDLGGWHIPLEGSISIDENLATELDLADNEIYELAIFHAERQLSGSSFRLQLEGLVPEPSNCVAQ